MIENELLESAVSEYKELVESAKAKTSDKLSTDYLSLALSKEHDWTLQGAQAIVSLANEYGAFMLRNALGLAIALGKEDGNLGF